MRITADTNILVRAITEDDPHQSRLAKAELAKAQVVALTLPALCELVWVLSKGYELPIHAIARALRGLLDSESVAVDRPAAEAGLAMLDRGGDFADGVIAYQGRWLGGQTLLSFDRKAATLLRERGEAVRLLS